MYLGRDDLVECLTEVFGSKLVSTAGRSVHHHHHDSSGFHTSTTPPGWMDDAPPATQTTLQKVLTPLQKGSISRREGNGDREAAVATPLGGTASEPLPQMQRTSFGRKSKAGSAWLPGGGGSSQLPEDGGGAEVILTAEGARSSRASGSANRSDSPQEV